MENYNLRKLNILSDISKLMQVIDDEVDWYIASFTEKDPKRKALAKFYFIEKQKERIHKAKEAYEQYK